MAVQISSILNARLKYPLISFTPLLLLFVLPTFQLFVYFVPLLLSTALCFLALVTLGPSVNDGESAPSAKDDKSWLGRLRFLQERARLWLESKLSVAESGGAEELPENNEEDCPDNAIVKTEHERRVRQLERTLRSLSFVSYEGIFAGDEIASLVDDAMDPAAADATDSAADDTDSAADAMDSAAGAEAENENVPESEAETTTNHRVNDTSPEGEQDREGSKIEDDQTMSDDAISWQQVEHTEAQKE